MAELIGRGIVGKYFDGNTTALIIGVVLTLAIGYLLGSLNFGIIISNLFYRQDIRKYGSKNAGMTNMMRTYGKKAAAMTFLGDALKTVIASFIGVLILGMLNAPFGCYGNYIGAFASVVGHVFPCYYGFKGGKGVVATAMLVLCTEPLLFLFLILIFVGLVYATKFISVGSVMCMLIYPLMLQRFTGNGMHIIISFILAILIIFLHRGNVKRVMNGTESKFTFKTKGSNNINNNNIDEKKK